MPRIVGLRARTLSLAVPLAPRGRSSTSGVTRKPSASSGSDASSRSRIGWLPQFENSSRCLPENRPLEVTGVILACDWATPPTCRSPSATPDEPMSTWDTARTPNGTWPARVVTPVGGANSTVATASPWGSTSTWSGSTRAHGAASPSTSSRKPSTIDERLRTCTVTLACPPGSTLRLSESTVTTGSMPTSERRDPGGGRPTVTPGDTGGELPAITVHRPSPENAHEGAVFRALAAPVRPLPPAGSPASWLGGAQA